MIFLVKVLGINQVNENTKSRNVFFTSTPNGLNFLLITTSHSQQLILSCAVKSCQDTFMSTAFMIA